MIPEFLKFRPPNLEAYNNKNAYYQKAVNEQRKATAAKLKEVKDQYSELATLLISRLNVICFRLLSSCIHNQVVNKVVEEKKRTHNTKLYKLWKKQRPPVPDCIVNISDKKLTLMENNALLFGLKHHILPQRIDPIAVKADIDSQIRRICKRNTIRLNYDKKNNIREATDRFVNEAMSICNSRKNRNLHKTLRHLSNNKSLKICKMDKGVGVVIMNEKDYYQKLDVIINDHRRFLLLNYNINTNSISECALAPWIEKERSVGYYCRTYIKPLVDASTYYRLLPTGSQPGRLYGTAKNHKPNCPMRPVLSAVNTSEYELAKWLEKQIKPLLNNRYSVTSSSAFIDELRQLKPRPTDHCVSFDIKSLFTNVPLKEVIDDIVQTVFPVDGEQLLFIKKEQQDPEAKEKDKTKKVTKGVLKNMLGVCSESIFLYRNQVYKQHEGVAMGSPLAPLLAEWFVSKIENEILKKDLTCKPVIYKRYVDDVFAIFKCEDDRDQFFSLLNAAHPNLEFTMETSTNFLPFLDTAVSIKNDCFETRVYRKPTNTGVVLNYHSVAPRKWKKSLVKCMLTRAYRVSSSLELFQSELETIRKTFLANSYPQHMIETSISDFIISHSINDESFRKNPIVDQKEKAIDSRKEVFIKIPFVGRPSSRLQRRIQEQLQNDDLRIKVAFSTTKVGEYFSLKSKCSILFKSNVVYKFTCSRDRSTTYIGETQRQLFRRIQDHRGDDKKSAIFNHLYHCNECQNVKNIADSFEILKHCTSTNIGSMEAILISKHCPSLNIQLGPGRGTIVPLTLY